MLDNMRRVCALGVLVSVSVFIFIKIRYACTVPGGSTCIHVSAWKYKIDIQKEHGLCRSIPKLGGLGVYIPWKNLRPLDL